MSKIAVFVLLFSLSTTSFADALFPLLNGRPQVDGNCWTYGTTHMLEARQQAREGIATMTNIEKSYRYWLIHDRLLNSFHRKALDEGDGSGEGVLDIGAFASDLWEIYENHGFEFLKTVKASPVATNQYPMNLSYKVPFQASPNSDGIIHPELIIQAEKDLINSSFTEESALALIDKTMAQAYQNTDPLLNQTPWIKNSVIQTKDTFKTILGSDFASGTHSAILLSSSLGTDVSNHQWFKYNSGRFPAIAIKDKEEILKLVRLSLDRGWPTTFETIDHVMTAIGYKTLGTPTEPEYVYAISDSSGAYAEQGISWVKQADALVYFTDATVYFDILKDVLPAAPSSKMAFPMVRLPRKH